MTALTPVLSRFWHEAQPWTLETYLRHDGYQGLRRALDMAPDDVINLVKESGLRGRGGAGFPTGTKWSFIDQSSAKPHYLVINADESEPGTCKDTPLMLTTPHFLVEGAIIAAYAIRARHAFIYLRGEVLPVLRRLQAAVAEAYAAGYLGSNIAGSGFDLDLIVHVGAGAYICGEETALLDSLEGKRGNPRLKPPFPANAGLFQGPTLINNVETLSNVSHITKMGGLKYAEIGTEKSTGTKLVSISGCVQKPGNYEIDLGTPSREILFDLAGGPLPGREFKAWFPGGSSSPVLTPAEFDLPYDFDSIAAAGSMLGSGAIIMIDDSVSMVDVALRTAKFYKHESCGKCTPCREGTWWLVQVLRRLDSGEGRTGDIELLVELCGNILGRSFCALGDGATSPITSAIQHFRDEFEAGMHTPSAELFPPIASTLFAAEATA